MSFRFLFGDPGPCPICSTPHCACTSNDGSITVPFLNAGAAPPLEAEKIQATLPPGEFTTGTYKRSAPKRSA